MQHRYALRFENGERRGETVQLQAGGMSFGRRPGNTVQILDASVSGRHAEIVLDERGVLLRDLGSTNGTRVGAERVSERRLAHGDEVIFGNVRMLFFDASVEAAPPPTPVSEIDTAGVTGSAEAAGESVRTISAEKVARSGSKSKIAIVVFALVALGGAGGWWWWRSKAQVGTVAARRAVEPVEGDLIAEGYSFEGDAHGWEALEGGAADFIPEASARRSGENGVRADLGAGEWSIFRSAPVRIPRGRALTAAGFLRVEDAAEGRLGIEFASSTGAAASVTAWSLPVPTQDALESVEVSADPPPGYDTARAVLLARTSGPPAAQGTEDPERAPVGAVEADDVSLVASAAAKPPLALTEYQLAPLGEPPTAAVLFKIDRVLLSGIAIGAEPAAGPAFAGLALTASVTEVGMRIAAGAPAREGGGNVFSMRVEPALAGAVASVGDGGYRTHQVEFRREGVESVLVGTGRDLVRVLFDGPAILSGRPSEGAFHLEAALGTGQGVLVQVAFQKERDEAMNLARSAREAEKTGGLGAALAQWGRVINEYPFESALLEEAETTRAKLVQGGLSEVHALSDEVERAHFFRLVDLFRRCREGARKIAARFQGSEVETAAHELETSIEAELGALEADLDRSEVKRLQAIEASLRARESGALAKRVHDYLTERFARELADGKAPGAKDPSQLEPRSDGSEKQ